MYKIIGGDGQEYGPITEADVCKWIAEGRLNEQSLAKTEGEAGFRALSTFPEFASALGTARAAHGVQPPPLPQPVDWRSRDYELDIGGCISRGWELFMNHLGILIGSTLLYGVIFLAVSFFLGLIVTMISLIGFSQEAQQTVTFVFIRDVLTRIVAALVMAPMTGGLYYVFIQAIRGQPVGIGELFIGFQRMFPQLFLGYLVNTFVVIVCFVPYTIIVLSRILPMLPHGQIPPDQLWPVMHQLWAAFLGSFPILLVCMVPNLYLLTSLLFVIPLIIDKEMDVWTAIKTSWRIVHKHWFTVFGLLFVSGLIFLAGVPLCCVGCILTFIISTAAVLCGYETIFGESRSI